MQLHIHNSSVRLIGKRHRTFKTYKNPLLNITDVALSSYCSRQVDRDDFNLRIQNFPQLVIAFQSLLCTFYNPLKVEYKGEWDCSFSPIYSYHPGVVLGGLVTPQDGANQSPVLLAPLSATQRAGMARWRNQKMPQLSSGFSFPTELGLDSEMPVTTKSLSLSFLSLGQGWQLFRMPHPSKVDKEIPDKTCFCSIRLLHI